MASSLRSIARWLMIINGKEAALYDSIGVRWPAFGSV